MKTNEQYLREIIAHDDEAIEFLDALMEEYKNKLKDDNEDSEVTELQEKIDELQEQLDLYQSVDLGLDTLHYRLEHGNLRIQEKLENLIRRCNTIPNAEPLFV